MVLELKLNNLQNQVNIMLDHHYIWPLNHLRKMNTLLKQIYGRLGSYFFKCLLETHHGELKHKNNLLKKFNLRISVNYYKRKVSRE